MNNQVCQSCAMPINQQVDIRGTERDGTKSEKFCAYCYSGGTYINPDITFDEMLQKGLKSIDASANKKFQKWIFKKSYPMMLKKCERWSHVR